MLSKEELLQRELHLSALIRHHVKSREACDDIVSRFHEIATHYREIIDHLKADLYMAEAGHSPKQQPAVLKLGGGVVTIPLRESDRIEEWDSRSKDELVAAFRERIDSAKRDLGDDLGGFSVVDLIADNFVLPLGYIRSLLVEMGEING